MRTTNCRGSLRYLFVSLSLIYFLITRSQILATLGSWQGPYLGGYLGGSVSRGDVSSNVGTLTSTSYFTTQADINAVNSAGTLVQNPSSFIVGVQAGHDWMWRQMVYGLVSDYGGLFLSSSKSMNLLAYPDNSNTYSIQTSLKTSWLFTLRGRLGYAAKLHWPSLFYATGGMAITSLEVTNSFSDNTSYGGTGNSSITENQIGWAGGVGIEFTPFGHLFANLEYLYVFVPATTTTSLVSNSQAGFGIPQQSLTSPFSTAVHLHVNLFKLGLSYRFYE